MGSAAGPGCCAWPLRQAITGIRVTFTNRVVREPGLVEVEVRDGMITPVHVVLIPEGATLVETREDRWGTSYKGRYGPCTKSQQLQMSMYRISAEVSAPTPYQVKERTVYAQIRGEKWRVAGTCHLASTL